MKTHRLKLNINPLDITYVALDTGFRETRFGGLIDVGIWGILSTESVSGFLKMLTIEIKNGDL
jgi:hypothetical protein